MLLAPFLLFHQKTKNTNNAFLSAQGTYAKPRFKRSANILNFRSQKISK